MPPFPFLFLIVVESLSRLIHEARRKGLISGLKVSISKVVTHLLFVDDVMLFGADTIREMQAIKYILTLFCKETRDGSKQ
jgi:hypothetical protein